MNYLQLVQRYRQEVDYATTGPTTVVGQTGDHGNACNWVAESYTELQNRHKWRWLRKEFTLTTSNGVDTYGYTSAIDGPTAAAITRFKSWAITDPKNPPRCYLQSSGVGSEAWLTYIRWEDFRSIYRIGSQTNSVPAFITIDPNDNIVLGPCPDAAYVISGEYNRSAQVLSGNTDTPEMPSDYHMLIVYLAMEDGGFFNEANEILSRSVKKGRRLLRQLEGTQLPMMRMAGPMV